MSGPCIKVAQDPCNHYVCIYLKSMHELRRLKPTTNEIFMRIVFFKFFVQVITSNCSQVCAPCAGTKRIIIIRFTALNLGHVVVNIGRFPFDQKFWFEFPENSSGKWNSFFQLFRLTAWKAKQNFHMVVRLI